MTKPLLPATYRCPIEATVDLIGGKWKANVLFILIDGPARFSACQARLPGVAPQVLTAALRDLERDGLIARESFAEVPPRVEYRLTAQGESLKPVVTAMCEWGLKYLRGLEQTASIAPLR